MILVMPSMPGDAILDHLRDLGLDDVGGGAEIFGLDRHDGRFDIGQLADRQPRGGEQAEDDEQQADDGREDRSSDRELGQPHVGAPSAAFDAPPPASPGTVTGAPSRSFCVPSVTTCSPTARPATICTSPTRRSPVRDLALLDAVVAHDEHENVALLGHERLLRHEQRVRSRRACSSTVRNMPGFSIPRSFGSSARTVTERVVGSTRESMLATLPANVLARARDASRPIRARSRPATGASPGS